MKSQAQQLFSMQPQADDLPKDIPDLGTLGNYLLTRQVASHLPAKLQILLHVMHTGLPYCLEIKVACCCAEWLCACADGERTLLMIRYKAGTQANADKWKSEIFTATTIAAHHQFSRAL